MEHLDALELNLSNERIRLAAAKTAAEKELRAVWVAQLEREVEQERIYLGIKPRELAAYDDDWMLGCLGL